MSDGDELDDLLAEVVVPPASGGGSAEKGPALPSSSSPASPATPAARSSSSGLSRKELESIRGLVEVSAGMLLGLKARGIRVCHPAGEDF
ncbi:MAG: hypothetical protein ABIF77_11175, partial [bacterium]